MNLEQTFAKLIVLIKEKRKSLKEKEADIVIDTSDKTPEEIVASIIKSIGEKK